MLTLRDISSQIGGTLVGNPELLVAGPSEPKFASEQQLAMALSNKYICLLYTSPSPRDGRISRMPSSA